MTPEVERRRVAPLQVLDDDEHGAVFGTAAAEVLFDEAETAQPFGLGGNDALCEAAQLAFERGGAIAGDQRFDQRLVRRRNVLDAGAVQDEAALAADPILKLAQQARLADAGVAADHQRAARPLGLGLAKGREQPRELGLASNEMLETGIGHGGTLLPGRLRTAPAWSTYPSPPGNAYPGIGLSVASRIGARARWR